MIQVENYEFLLNEADNRVKQLRNKQKRGEYRNIGDLEILLCGMLCLKNQKMDLSYFDQIEVLKEFTTDSQGKKYRKNEIFSRFLQSNLGYEDFLNSLFENNTNNSQIQKSQYYNSSIYNGNQDHSQYNYPSDRDLPSNNLFTYSKIMINQNPIPQNDNRSNEDSIFANLLVDENHNYRGSIFADIMVDEREDPAKAELRRAEKDFKDNKDNDCKICLGNLMFSENMEVWGLKNCGHCFHKECLSMHIKNEIDHSKIPIQCPHENCKLDILHEDLFENCERDDLEKYEKFAFNKFVEINSENTAWCPTAGCSFVFEFNRNSPNNDFNCPLCAKSYCLNCKTTCHKGMTCAENKVNAVMSVKPFFIKE